MMEIYMNAVERIDNYSSSEVPIEEDSGKTIPPKTWPSEGEIQFINYSAAYDEKLDPVLKKVNITVCWISSAIYRFH